MRAIVRSLIAVVVLLSVFSPRTGASQSDPRSGLVVSTEWLNQHLSDPNLVLLHVGDRAEYDAGHIRGARYIDLDDISESDHATPGGLMLQMPRAERLREMLASLGISNDSRIVVYYGNDWVTPATRVVFTLDHAGLGRRTSLLDGGMQLWKRENKALTREIPAARLGTLSALSLKPIVVDGSFVRNNIGKSGMSIVDGRAASFYDGVQTGGGRGAPHKTGHIAGAKSVPFTEITDRELKLKSADELRALFAKAGVKPGDTIIGYCHIGQQATGMLFAARSLGHKVLLYDGSFEDWSARADNPVETTARR